MVLRTPAAYLEFVERHRRLGFTDLSTVMPAPEDLRVLRHVAAEVLPALRAAG